MDMIAKKLTNFCLILALMIIGGCTNITEEDKELAAYFSIECYEAGKNTPAEYASNQCGDDVTAVAKGLLSGRLNAENPVDLENARTLLKSIKSDIEAGKNWQPKEVKKVAIPYAEITPVIDGVLDDAVWEKALTFKGEYALGSHELQNSDAIWKLMWDENYFYLGCFMPQIKCVSHPEYPFLEDAVELFIGTSVRYRTYWEIVIAPNGTLYDALGHNNRWGHYIATPEDSVADLKHAAVITPQVGYTVEIAVPWSEFPAYSRGNSPQENEEIHFALIRCIRGKQATAYPLLYGGHNIFGHAKGVLVK